MSAPDTTDLEQFLMKLTHAAACCGQLALAQGRGEEGAALYFLEDGIDRLADEVRGWVDEAIEAKCAGPVAVT